MKEKYQMLSAIVGLLLGVTLIIVGMMIPFRFASSALFVMMGGFILGLMISFLAYFFCQKCVASKRR